MEPPDSCVQLIHTNDRMPLLGLGTWKGEPDKLHAAIACAMKSGYRMIDCAAIYGNEKCIGSALKTVFDSKCISRSDVFVVSKLWNNSHHPDDVSQNFDTIH